MIGPNDLKYYVISDETKKYNEVNHKLIKLVNLYFYTMKNHSYQLNQIENKLNEYNINGEVKIKQLLENQQNIIKELIKIINNFLLEKRNSELAKKFEEQIIIDKNDKINKIDYKLPLKQKKVMRNNNNFHIFDQLCHNHKKSNNKHSKNFKEKNNINENTKNISTNETLKSNITKSVEDKINTLYTINPKRIINQKKLIALNIVAPKSGKEFKGALSFLNVKLSIQKRKKKLFGKFLNREIKESSKPNKKKLIKSKSTSEMTFIPKIIYKPNTNLNKNLYLKINNISNNNPYNIKINNYYTIDEEKNDNINGKNESITMINDRQSSISSCNLYENNSNLAQIFTKRKKKIKYRGNSRKGRISSTEKDNNKNMVRIKNTKEIPLKTDFYLNTNSSFPNFTLTNTSLDKLGNITYNKRSNSSLTFFNGNLNNYKNKDNKFINKFETEIYSVPYIINGKRILPSRFTKEVLSSSYKKLNKYEEKRFKNYLG